MQATPQEDFESGIRGITGTKIPFYPDGIIFSEKYSVTGIPMLKKN